MWKEAKRTFWGRMAVCAGVHGAILVLRASADENRVVGVRLDVLLEILGPLERLAAEVALVGLQRDVDADVRRDVVALDRRGPARVPLARQVQVVGALATNMLLTKMILGRSVSVCLFFSFFSFFFFFQKF
jgi:hypothetical protein